MVVEDYHLNINKLYSFNVAHRPHLRLFFFYRAFKFTIMWLDQSCKGVELRNFDMKHYNLIYKFLSNNFKGHFQWLAFDYKFFVSDDCKGRHETMKQLRQLHDYIFGESMQHSDCKKNENLNE